MIVVIGNGKSRSVLNLEKLNEHITYGCNALFRDYSPTYLVCGDTAMTWDICNSGYSRKNQCYFKMFDRLPADEYEMLKMTFEYCRGENDPKIIENEPQTDEFVMFGESNVTVIYWVGINEKTEQLEWWEDTEYTSGTAALTLACKMNPIQDIYCIGFDYFLDRAVDNMYLGTAHYLSTLADVEKDWESKKGTWMDRKNWIIQHEKIEREFPSNNIYHVGKDLTYAEFNEMLR